MTNLILWAAALVLYFTYTFPPLASSENIAAQLVRSCLSIAVGGILGAGVGHAVSGVLL